MLVLSNRTHLAWLDALETELRDKDMITVVVTAIGLSPTLAWLWKRQWIDFRRCASADSKRRSALPVPEALDRARLPLRPALAHHLLCSMAGLGLVGANIVADAQQSDLDTLGMLTGISTGLLSVACMEICRSPRFAASFQHLADRCMECFDAFMRCAVYSLF